MTEDPRPASSRWRRHALASGLVAAAAGAFVVSCPIARAPDVRPVLDLARRAPVAELRAGFDTVLFGTPAAEGLQENGFRREGRQDQDDVWAAAAPTARLLLRWTAPEPRLAVLDVEPLPGAAGLRAEVALNGTVLSEFTLREGRRRYAVEVPESAQRPGGNRIRLRFGEPEPGTDRQPSRARVYGLAVGPATDPSLRALAAEGAPAVLSMVPGATGRTLIQTGPSVLRFALALPERAELRFAPAVRRFDGGGAAARLRVTLEEEGAAPRELWARDLRPGADPREVRLRLPLPAGAPVRLAFQVETGQGAASAVWHDPRIWGSAPAAAQPLASARVVPVESPEAVALRRSLAGSNVLLVILDAAGARHFGCYGYPRATTPEIDRLAAEGVLFERAYTPAAFTYAAIAALWTSQVPDRGGAEWIRYGDGFLPADRLTLAEVLSANGVHAAGFVANPSASAGFGLDRGFAEFHELYRPPWSASGMPDAAVSSRAAREWLARAPSGRFFAYLHFREPHYPYAPPPPFATLFVSGTPAARLARSREWQQEVALGRRAPSPEEANLLARLYDANLAYADRELGALRGALEQAGLWDRTVVIVTADHGEAMYEHGWIGHNAQVYEESIHVPLVIRFPSAAAVAPRRVANVTSLVDVAPTIADVFGLRARTAGRFRGRSLLADALGAAANASAVARTSGATYALVHGRYKLIHDISSAGDQLYDLEADPREATDLAARLPVRTAVFRQALHRWLLDLRGTGAAPSAARLDARQRETLRALGYAR